MHVIRLVSPFSAHAKAEIAAAKREADEARQMWEDAEDEADEAENKAAMAKRLKFAEWGYKRALRRIKAKEAWGIRVIDGMKLQPVKRTGYVLPKPAMVKADWREKFPRFAYMHPTTAKPAATTRKPLKHQRPYVMRKPTMKVIVSPTLKHKKVVKHAAKPTQSKAARAAAAEARADAAEAAREAAAEAAAEERADDAEPWRVPAYVPRQLFKPTQAPQVDLSRKVGAKAAPKQAAKKSKAPVKQQSKAAQKLAARAAKATQLHHWAKARQLQALMQKVNAQQKHEVDVALKLYRKTKAAVRKSEKDDEEDEEEDD